MPANRMTKFGVFIDTWDTMGEVLAMDAEPAVTMTATDAYRWLSGNRRTTHAEGR